MEVRWAGRDESAGRPAERRTSINVARSASDVADDDDDDDGVALLALAREIRDVRSVFTARRILYRPR